MSDSVAGQVATRRQVLSWALYDWGNSAFATTVVAGFFPVFFKDFWSAGVPATESTRHLGNAVSLASLVVAILAPALASIVDRGAPRKLMLALFAGGGALCTGALSLIPRGNWSSAIWIYTLAYIAWLLSLVVYDAMLVLISDERDVDKISGLGYALGYLGGGLLFLINVAMTLKPSLFGLVAADAAPELVAEAQARAVQLSFLTVAVWWVLFSIPLFTSIKEPWQGKRPALWTATREGFVQLADTFRRIRRWRYVFQFLLAYWLYIDGVDTVITMAVDFGKSIGFATSDLIGALLMVQFVAFPCAWFFGWAAQRLGPKRMILAGLFIYMLVTGLATQLSAEPYHLWGLQISPFYLLAGLVGLAQGGVQALSRSLFTRLIPADHSTEFFGFMNMVGRFAAIIGPWLMGNVAYLTGSPRAGIGSIAILLVAGGALLLRLDVEAGRLAALGAAQE